MKTIVNLGDMLIHLDEWQTIRNPDVLMIPIGGKVTRNTMDETEAFQVVREMNPKFVILCHYNFPAFLTKRYNPADESMFKMK